MQIVEEISFINDLFFRLLWEGRHLRQWQEELSVEWNQAELEQRRESDEERSTQWCSAWTARWIRLGSWTTAEAWGSPRNL